MPDLVLTLVRPPGGGPAHLLCTEASQLRWARADTLCGQPAPDLLGWQAHHSAFLADVCPTCVAALAARVQEGSQP